MSIIVDFANLTQDGEVDSIPKPRQKELRDFFQKYAPNITDCDIQNWLGTTPTKSFYVDWNLTRQIAKNIVEKNGLTSEQLIWLDNLKVFQMANLVVIPEIEYTSQTWIDLNNHKIEKRLESPEHLEIGEIYRLLYDEFLALINHQLKIGKCAAPDCEHFFLPTPRGRNQEYCSRQCYERIYSRKRREKEKRTMLK